MNTAASNATNPVDTLDAALDAVTALAAELSASTLRPASTAIRPDARGFVVSVSWLGSPVTYVGYGPTRIAAADVVIARMADAIRRDALLNDECDQAFEAQVSP